jgi:ribosomal protein S12
MITHPALMLELTRAVTAARVYDADQFRQGRRVETETASILASRAPAEAGVCTNEQVVAAHRPDSIVHTGARLHSRRDLARDRGGGKHAARRH